MFGQSRNGYKMKSTGKQPGFRDKDGSPMSRRQFRRMLRSLERRHGQLSIQFSGGREPGRQYGLIDPMHDESTRDKLISTLQSAVSPVDCRDEEDYLKEDLRRLPQGRSSSYEKDD